MNIEETVVKFMRLRALKAERENEIKKIEDVMDKVRSTLLEHFQNTGVELIRTDAGTVYKSVRTTASIADWDIFLESVKKGGLWHLLEHRCSSKEAENYVAVHDEPPPGVNLNRVATINIRRSN
jgi:hypothetical protein